LALNDILRRDANSVANKASWKSTPDRMAQKHCILRAILANRFALIPRTSQ
jgi:hypothetical protein